MKGIYEIIKQLQATTKRTEKENILSNNKANEELKMLLQYVYDPFLIYGIQSKKLSKFLKMLHNESEFDHIFEVFNYLIDNPTGRDIDVQKVAAFINASDEELQEFYIKCITKSLKTGCSSTTLNKVFGKGFVNKFDCMLARNYYDEIDKVNSEMFVTLKMDGHRMLAIKQNGHVKFFTRQGKPIEGLVEIAEEMKQLPDDFVYDGELLLRNDKGLHSKDLYRETTKIARKDGVKKNLEFYIFDLLPVDEFKEGTSKQLYCDRRANLDLVFHDKSLNWVKKVVLLYQGKDKGMIETTLTNVIDEGFEGIMINLGNYKYTLNRSKGLLKVKKFKEVDLRIVSIEHGTNKFENTLGRINVEYKNNIVGVGTGFNDSTRDEIYNNPDKYIGKIAKIKYFEESSNSKTGEVSLRFPVFEEVRWDKNEPSLH